VSEPKPDGKSFVISKRLVWEAWLRVKDNKGAAGVDEESIEEFERDLQGNLYKLWNRMSSGSYVPPPVRAVEIPKKGGRGVRTLGVPTVADRVAQTVAYLYLEPEVEPVFHQDSYGYRPGRSAHDALWTCRQRCWSYDWALDLDLKSFFDSLSHSLVLKAVAHHTNLRWILLYVERWLKAPLQLEDGTRKPRDRGSPQGSAISPVLANIFLHYALECATNVKRGDAVGSRLSMQCSTEDGGLMALRDRPMGDDSKPPHAALVSDRRGERCGHGARDASGGGHGDDRC
jgi:RNA-directed DNA polymerase